MASLATTHEEQIQVYDCSFLTSGEETAFIKDLITHHKGKVVREEAMKKVRLAYPIGKHTYAFFHPFVIEFPKETCAAFERELQFQESLIRSMITRFKVQEQQSTSSRAPYRPSQSVARKPHVAQAPAALTNEQLSKKIEEILQ